MGWLASVKAFFKMSGGEPTFTRRVQQVFALARKEADRLHHNYIGTEHVLLGLIKSGSGVPYKVFEKLGLNLENARKKVEGIDGTGPDVQFPFSLPYTPRLKKVLHLAREEARALRHTYVGTEHLLLGALREGDGIAAQVLRNCGLDLQRVRLEVLKELNPNYNSDDEFYTRYFAHVKEASANPKDFWGNSLGDIEFNFTPRASQVLVLARKEAERLSHNFVSPEHILLGLIKSGVGTAYNVFEELKLNPENLRIEVEKRFATEPIEKTEGSPPHYTSRAKKVLALVRVEARALNHTYISTEHLLLGLLRDADGIASQVLKNCGADIAQVRVEVLKEMNPFYDPDIDIDPRQFAPIEVAESGEVPKQEQPEEEPLDFALGARQVLALARIEADQLNHNYLGTEHILLGLMEPGQGLTSNVLARKGMTLENVRAMLAKGPAEKIFGHIPYTPRVKRVIGHACNEARALNHACIDPKHLLLGLLQEDEGPVADIFKKFGLDMEALRQEILNKRKPPQ